MEDQSLTLQKALGLIVVFMGFGLLVWLVIHYVRKDNRTTTEKLVDKARAVVDR